MAFRYCLNMVHECERFTLLTVGDDSVSFTPTVSTRLLCEHVVPLEVISRSSLFSDMRDSAAADAEVRVDSPKGVLSSWLQGMDAMDFRPAVSEPCCSKRKRQDTPSGSTSANNSLSRHGAEALVSPTSPSCGTSIWGATASVFLPS